LRTKGQYRGGLPDGLWEEYFETGVKAREGAFQGGEKHGLWTGWNPDGTVQGTARYEDGRYMGRR
jgi:antitoxin component YwqK of YwqJK toxin-antitoxin module